jgi:uncharacterized protein (DUF2147 family)
MSCRSAIVIILLFTFSSLAWSDELAGLWEEYEDRTGNPEALIRIEQLSDNTYEGKIEKILPDTPEKNKMICTHCSGNLSNQPLLGLRILSGMTRKDKLNFEGGKILDPDEGKIYRCHIRLSEDGKTIKVTGYINFKLFGQSEIWRRIN